MLSALNDYKEPLYAWDSCLAIVENVPREILLARAGLDKLADCRKIKCGIFAFKLAFRKNSNCLPRHVLEAAEAWLSLAPDRISAKNSRSQSRAAAIRLPQPQTNTMKSSPFYFCFPVLDSVPLDNLKAGPPLEAILVIFGRRALIFFC